MCPLRITLSTVISQNADFFDLPQQGSILRWNKDRILSQLDSRHDIYILVLSRLQVNTHDYRCSRQPEWSLWPSEMDFSSGHWTDRWTDGWRQRQHELSYQLAWRRVPYLTTVRSRAERASLWKVMTTLDAGRSDFHCLCLQLQQQTHIHMRSWRKSIQSCLHTHHTHTHGCRGVLLKHASCVCSMLHKV